MLIWIILLFCYIFTQFQVFSYFHFLLFLSERAYFFTVKGICLFVVLLTSKGTGGVIFH